MQGLGCVVGKEIAIIPGDVFFGPVFCVRFCVALLSLWSVSWKGILLVFTQPIYFAADGNSGEMAFPLHEPGVRISTTQSKAAYLSAKHSDFIYVI